MSWRDEAACADMALWWFARRPADKEGQRVHDDARKTVCRNCPVLMECRAEARELQEPSGVWGGESPEERCHRLDLTHGPVPRSCIHCGQLYTPRVSQVRTCSEECRKAYRLVGKYQSDRKRKAATPSQARPCPRCGETQNMATGVCMGWQCVRARKVEVRDDVAS